jgi:hypothetical protein
MFDKVFKVSCLIIVAFFLGAVVNSFETTSDKHESTLRAYNDCQVRGVSPSVCTTLLGN